MVDVVLTVNCSKSLIFVRNGIIVQLTTNNVNFIEVEVAYPLK